jgi:hypothetical protein
MVLTVRVFILSYHAFSDPHDPCSHIPTHGDHQK